jgi:4-hydroxy-tetrahydrodipicolinate reductase
MTFRVIPWGIGAAGTAAVIGILGHPDLELAGAGVYSAEKDGRDVGELCGLDPVGVFATRDRDALLATPADCVCFTPGRSWVRDPSQTLAELLAILRSGKNVVNLWWPTLVHSRAHDKEVHAQLEAACREGGSSLFTMGMDPGHGTAGLALAALPLAREIGCVRMTQIMDNSKWEGEGITLFFGFGQPDTSRSPMLAPGVTTGYHATTLHLLADAIGVTIDGIVEEHSVIRADEAFDIRSGHIPAGTVSGIRYQVKGMVEGEARVVVEHVERLREQDFPELGFRGDGYRVEVDGTPCIRLDMTLSAPPGFTGDLIAVPSAMSVVNAVPQVCQAPPGVLTMLDLRPFPSKNVYGRRSNSAPAGANPPVLTAATEHPST